MDSPKEKLRDSAMAENKKNILDCISLVGTSPCIFEGEKTYISTGAVNHDSIDLSLAEKVTYQNRPSRANLSVKNGDILFAKMCGTQKTVRIDKKNAEYLFSTGFYAVRAKETVITSPLLYYLLDSEQFLKQKDQNCSGATQKAITNEGLKKIKISLPPLEEQHKIAAVLDKISDLIAKRRQQLDRLDELVKSRFVEMFGDPVDDSCRYQKTPLGAIANVGSSKRIFEKEYVNEGVPFYRTKEIVELSKGHKITTELFITKERYDEICKEYGAPQKGDLLISAVGTIGIIWIVDGKNNFYFKDGNLLRVSVSNNFNPIYLKMLLETLISAQKQKISTGTAYAALTISMLKEMMVYIVPMDEQNQFAAFVDQTEKTKTAISHSLQKLETLKKALMQSFFSKE